MDLSILPITQRAVIPESYLDEMGHMNVLINHTTSSYSFPYTVFERAVLSLLSEIKPEDVVGCQGGNGKVAALAGRLAEVEGRIAELEAELRTGDVPAIARVLRGHEERRRGLAAELAEAKAEEAHPLAGSWGEARTVIEALDRSPDPEEAHSRLRLLLRRVVAEGWLLVVRRGLVQLAALQLFFTGDGKREYLIAYRRPYHSFQGRVEAKWLKPLSFADAGLEPGDIDLRRRADAKKLEAALQRLDLAALVQP